MQHKYRYLLVKSFRTELYNLEIFESIWKFWFKSHEICAKIKNFCCAFLMSFIHHQSPLITIIDHSSSSRSSLARLPLETLPLSLACPATGARQWPWPSMGPRRLARSCLMGVSHRQTHSTISLTTRSHSQSHASSDYVRTVLVVSTHGATGAERPQLFNWFRWIDCWFVNSIFVTIKWIAEPLKLKAVMW